METMKKLVLIVVTIVLFHAINSCNQTTPIDDSTESIIQLDTSYQAKKDEKSNIGSLPELSSEHSFIGLNISSKNIKRSNYFNCRGMIIQESMDNDTLYAISQLAIDQKSCNNGISKIFLEKKVRMDGSSAVFEIIDEIDINQKDIRTTYHFTRLNIENNSDDRLYIVRTEVNSDSLLQVKEGWYVNHLSGKFDPIKSNKILREEDFYEMDY